LPGQSGERSCRAGATVRDLLHTLRTVNPALAAKILTPEDELASGMLMIVGASTSIFCKDWIRRSCGGRRDDRPAAVGG